MPAAEASDVALYAKGDRRGERGRRDGAGGAPRWGDGPGGAPRWGEVDTRDRCTKAQVTIVARVLGAQNGADLYVARYANCFRGRSEWNVHAEEFMLADPQLLALLREGSDAGGDRARMLRLYMSYQPCHHSGGRLPEAKTPSDCMLMASDCMLIASLIRWSAARGEDARGRSQAARARRKA